MGFSGACIYSWFNLDLCSQAKYIYGMELYFYEETESWGESKIIVSVPYFYLLTTGRFICSIKSYRITYHLLDNSKFLKLLKGNFVK